jgi:hypothetical protein
MNISVTYDDSDVAKALSKIIKDPNAEEFVKLFTPIICGSSQTVDHFFKLAIGNKLPDILPDGTLCRMPVSSISYGIDREATLKKYADSDGCIIVTIIGFRGYHEYSQYTVEYTGITNAGDARKDTTYVRETELEVIEEF